MPVLPFYGKRWKAPCLKSTTARPQHGYHWESIETVDREVQVGQLISNVYYGLCVCVCCDVARSIYE